MKTRGRLYSSLNARRWERLAPALRFGRLRDHLRGREGASAGRTVAIATFLMVITCLSDPAAEVYRVVLCVRAQERNATGAKTVLAGVQILEHFAKCDQIGVSHLTAP